MKIAKLVKTGRNVFALSVFLVFFFLIYEMGKGLLSHSWMEMAPVHIRYLSEAVIDSCIIK